jgi:hypothetical protein
MQDQMQVHDEALRGQIDRILCSEEFRSSEVLRRLLAYLAEKAISGEADQLKEYTIAIEGLGKPSSYDPQHHASVRILVGRFRQKISQYYQAEGKDDPVIVDLPKGRFKLICDQREEAASTSPVLPDTPVASIPSAPIVAPSRQISLRVVGMSLGLVALLALIVGAYFLGRSGGALLKAEASAWTPQLEELWGPVANRDRPLILVIEDPLFAEVRSSPRVYYRDQSLNDWKDLINSSDMKALTAEQKTSDVQPSRYYTSFGEAEASLLLGKFLGPREKNLSLVRASELSWQQVSDNNIVFVGAQNLFFVQLQGMPFEPQLVPTTEGIRNLHPKAGEPAMFVDQYTLAPAEEGVIYALVTHLPGPLRRTNIVSFTSSRSAGRIAAVQLFTDPSFARELAAKLEQAAGGRIPRYYQVVLKVKFKDNVPTETSYILSRVLN